MDKRLENFVERQQALRVFCIPFDCVSIDLLFQLYNELNKERKLCANFKNSYIEFCVKMS